ncbi:MAG TPA: glutathione S-transferase family protein [Steroidobacteraceae bacterium]|nr:glutathione S-transferase family protein [Steroidobacteraceae bacterium]
MKPSLFAHPFASYCQKVLIALYEKGTPFTYRKIGPEDPTAMSELEALWPLKKFPVLVDEGQTYVESSVIIEYLAIRYPGAVQLIPEDPQGALEVRMLDRFFDNYVMTPMQKIVADFIRVPSDRDALGVKEARSLLDSAYGWLNGTMAARNWASGSDFSLADCAAAPALFYADWVHEVPDKFPYVRAYRGRLLARPSVARSVDEARPFRQFFPPGAPNRD